MPAVTVDDEVIDVDLIGRGVVALAEKGLEDVEGAVVKVVRGQARRQLQLVIAAKAQVPEGFELVHRVRKLFQLVGLELQAVRGVKGG